MRAVVQKVSRASVRVGDEVVGAIGAGLLVLVGVGRGDAPEDARSLADRVVHLRIFANEGGRFDRSVLDAGGGILAVSQFTLYGDCRHGRRPDFTEAAPAVEGRPLYDLFVARLREYPLEVATGRFGASMLVELCNDGPVTVLLDSRKRF